jgi:uroporphyrinogen decarboxylase
MTSRERILAALNHREADRVPFDVGGTAQSGIHKSTYKRLRQCLELKETEIQVRNMVTQEAQLDEDFLDRLEADSRFVGRLPKPGGLEVRDEGAYLAFTDEWGIGWHMPKENGFFYDMYVHPFNVDDVKAKLQVGYCWLDPTADWRFVQLRERLSQPRQKNKAVVMGSLCAGQTEIYAWLRGFERFYLDLGGEPETAEFFLDKITDLKMAYWDRVLSEAGDLVDVVNESDDVAGQETLLMSPATYRRVIKPRHQRLFGFIKKKAPHVKLFLHSCGAVRPLIGDLIEMGVDILNPVQINAKGMNLFELKKEFGRDICFWGGGVDTQRVLSWGTVEEVKDNTRRNIEALAPGGGFVFTPVHIVQANVPVENYMAMWETWMKYRTY